MKRKTIKKIIAGKLHKLVASIPETEHEIRNILMNHVIVTGGCIPSMLLDEDVNDFDIYFDSRDRALQVASYYMKSLDNPMIFHESPEGEFYAEDSNYIAEGGLLKPNGRFELGIGEDQRSEGVTEKGDYSPVFVSQNAITLSNKVQLVFRFFGSPDEIHSTYDFVHCTNYFYQGEVVLKLEALEAILTKELVYTGSQYPLCSIIRIRKFVKRGWKIHAGHILKMAMQLNEMDLKNVQTLQDQLIGVDSAYFSRLIDRLQEQGGDITIDMICNMVDSVFD